MPPKIGRSVTDAQATAVGMIDRTANALRIETSRVTPCPLDVLGQEIFIIARPRIEREEHVAVDRPRMRLELDRAAVALDGVFDAAALAEAQAQVAVAFSERRIDRQGGTKAM